MISYFKEIVVTLGFLTFASSAHAGKVDQVKDAVKSSCQKELSTAEVMDAVLKAFDCTPGTDVKVADCQIKCQKENNGSVVGK